ncbi:MFS transporter [Microbacterium betulae]|uniref:MFS transporter n=1 Tax=Microbacterium betulae TaxID=2981139 RepID=A0AA97FEW0_9MICO|nr:MFS transporter [Microbacterium sp. AB]WOF21730.1 MFS transporter [Microbacterium sp. AB]
MTGTDPRGLSGSVPIPHSPAEATTIWRRPYLLTTVGAVALIFLAALQSLAVTTVMPVVAADLDGQALYAVAFSGTFATSVIGMVAAGAWSDRTGPTGPLYTAAAFFVAGLAVDALAVDMPMLVAGRLVMGLGSGGQVVALYVVVARVFPAHLQGRVMAAFSAAWIVPSLVGPVLAGAVAEHLHWRWVFAGVAFLTLVAFAMIAPRLRGLGRSSREPRVGGVGRRLILAVVVAAAALGLSLAGELDGALGWIVAVGALVVVAAAILPLLPVRTLRLGRGLPSVVAMRGLVAGALFGAEIYVPYLLIARFGFSPTLAGAGLTLAALTWAVSADVSGRLGDRIGNRRIALTGASLLSVALVACLLTAALGLPAWVPIVFWGFAGLGMGIVYPRLTVLTIAYSSARDQGFNSSALQISDSIGASAAMAVMGLAFTALEGSDARFAVVFGIGLLLALLAIVPGLRLGHARETESR